MHLIATFDLETLAEAASVVELFSPLQGLVAVTMQAITDPEDLVRICVFMRTTATDSASNATDTVLETLQTIELAFYNGSGPNDWMH